MKHNQFYLSVLALLLVLLAACSATATAPAPAATDQPVEAAATEKPMDMPSATEKPTAAPTAMVVEPGEIPEITIEAQDFSYTIPSSISEGWVRVKLTNSGAEPHHVQFLRLNDGVTFNQFQEALQQGAGPAMALVKQVGGVGVVAPTGSAQSIVNLPAGEYVILCLVDSASDQMPHFAKGMIATFPVQAAAGAMAAEPEPDLTVQLQDFTFDLPDSLPVGPSLIKVVNNGPENHEMNLVQLADGKSAADVMAWLETPDGPPPFTPVGGMNGLDTGLTGYVEADLQPGSYAAICNIPSPSAGGHRHYTLGMIQEFTVGDSAASGFPIGTFVSVKDKALSYQFNEDGTFAYLVSQTPVLNGTYAVDGDTFNELTNDDTDPACQEHPAYKWSFDGATLSFQSTGEDTCRGRGEAMADTYTLAEETNSGFPFGKWVSVTDKSLYYLFNEDGTFAFYIGQTPGVQGTYRIEGDTYTELTNDDSSQFCQEHPSYKWSFDGTTLSFQRTGEDSCKGRRDAMADTYVTP